MSYPVKNLTAAERALQMRKTGTTYRLYTERLAQSMIAQAPELAKKSAEAYALAAKLSGDEKKAMNKQAAFLAERAESRPRLAPLIVKDGIAFEKAFHASATKIESK